MNPENQFNKIVFIMLAIVIVIVAVLVGNVLMNRYEAVAQGILGMTTLYALTRLQFSGTGIFNEGSIDYTMKFSRYVKFLMLRLALAIVMFWAVQEILGAARYLVNAIVN